jgi:RNA polymerase sigma-70 factor (ECF subfamily)
LALERAEEPDHYEVPPVEEVIGAEPLFRAHADFIAAFVQRLGVKPADVDDAVQEVFVVAHRKGGYRTGPATARSWLGAIALRIAANQRRKSARADSPVGGPDELALVDSSTPEAQLEHQRALTRVQAALETLSPEHRVIFVLFEIEGERAPSIAEALKVPEGTVYSRIHHARKKFMTAYRRGTAT